MLTVIDEFTHESLAIKTKRQLNSTDVLDCLNDLFTERGVPEHIRSDNGGGVYRDRSTGMVDCSQGQDFVH